MNSQARILDPCCGSRMMWFDRARPDVIFGDIRSETLTVTDRSHGRADGARTLIIVPDVLLDFRALPYADAIFRLVAFDPPHLVRAGAKSWMAAKYGKLGPDYLNAGQTVNVTIGAGGLPGTVDVTNATGDGAGGMATGTSRAYGGGSGASGASSGCSGWANTQPEVNQFFGGTGGSGGSNGTGYGGGGGGKGGNGNYCQAAGGTGGDNGKNGGAGVTANATIISGGAGGSGAVIIEY